MESDGKSEGWYISDSADGLWDDSCGLFFCLFSFLVLKLLFSADWGVGGGGL